MSRRNLPLEIGTGLFVLLGFAALAFLTTQLPGSGLKVGSAGNYYRVMARFDSVGDLKAGAPVSMSGVTVGQVASVKLDPADYKALVVLSIDRHYDKIPDDSDAAIQTAGLLGAKYVNVGAGGAATYLKDGSQIELTQSAFVLEGLVNKLFSALADKNGGDSKGDSK
jgi:phospholipid/cholesterol/gamma-HCH transport system substrate-binding protein